MTHIWFIYRLSLPVFELSQITLVVGSVAAAPVSAHHRSVGNNNHELNWRIKRSKSSHSELNCLSDDDVPGNKAGGLRVLFLCCCDGHSVTVMRMRGLEFQDYQDKVSFNKHSQQIH